MRRGEPLQGGLGRQPVEGAPPIRRRSPVLLLRACAVPVPRGPGGANGRPICAGPRRPARASTPLAGRRGGRRPRPPGRSRRSTPRPACFARNVVGDSRIPMAGRFRRGPGVPFRGHPALPARSHLYCRPAGPFSDGPGAAVPWRCGRLESHDREEGWDVRPGSDQPAPERPTGARERQTGQGDRHGPARRPGPRPGPGQDVVAMAEAAAEAATCALEAIRGPDRRVVVLGLRPGPGRHRPCPRRGRGGRWGMAARSARARLVLRLRRRPW